MRQQPASAEHRPARALYADTLEQLAYGSENRTWRNFFLSGATELREGGFGTPTATSAPAILAQLTPEQLLDAIAISVDDPRAWDLDLSSAAGASRGARSRLQHRGAVSR